MLQQLKNLLANHEAEVSNVLSHLKEDAYSKAFEEANRLYAERGGTDPAAATVYGWLLLERGLYDEAEGVLKKARPLFSENPCVQLTQAKLAILRDKAAVAEQTLDDAGQLDLSSGQSLVAAKLYLELERLEKATRAYRRAVDSGNFGAEEYIELSQLLESGGRLAEAADYVDECARQQHREGLWRRAADLWHRAGNFERALKAEKKALEHGHARPEDWYELGGGFFQLELYYEAIRVLEKAVRFDPLESDYHMALGNARFYVGHFEEALGAFRNAEKRGHDKYEVYLAMGETALELGDIGLARDIRKKLEPWSDQPEVAFLEAMLFQQLGRYTETLSKLERAESAYLGVVDFHFARALAFLHDDQIQKMWEQLQMVARSEPDSEPLLFEFGAKLIRAGRAKLLDELYERFDLSSHRSWRLLEPVWKLFVSDVENRRGAEQLLAQFFEQLQTFERTPVISHNLRPLEALGPALEGGRKDAFEAMLDVLRDDDRSALNELVET